MQPEEKIRLLCAQLGRAENPVVIESVAAELHAAIEDFKAKQLESSNADAATGAPLACRPSPA